MPEQTVTHHHGSKTLNEMVERLSVTGLEPWQVNEEINEFTRTLDENDANTERIIAECAQSRAITTPTIVEDVVDDDSRRVCVHYFHHPFTFTMKNSTPFDVDKIDFDVLIAQVRETMNGRGGFSGIRIALEEDGETVANATIEMEEKESVPFERIRRITGYLVGTLDRFNDAKRAEESQRVKHGVAAK